MNEYLGMYMCALINYYSLIKACVIFLCNHSFCPKLVSIFFFGMQISL